MRWLGGVLLFISPIQPLVHHRRLICLKFLEQRFRTLINKYHRTMLHSDQPLRNRVVEKIHQPLVVLTYVQKTTGLLVHAQLRPCHHLKELFECPKTTG